ncbi:MAG TPA: sigma-54 dependent transcriptional regulator [Enhygromyxa sp.]|nr:sigma-54 dependent transcriptional regulator [Enhygromyxa sp.]
MADTPASEAAFTGTILVVDDEKNIRRTLRMVLEGEGATVIEAETGELALAQLERALAADPDDRSRNLPNAVIMDVLLGGMTGIEVLERLSSLGEDGRPPLPVIMISGHASVADAVRATRLGAFDFFEKPLSRDRVIVSVRNALRQSKAERELRDLRLRVHGEIIGTAEPMRELMRMVAKVGRTKARVLITGESGTGKELVARAIHEASDRHDHAFVKVNCAAIPRELIESELFGHERGAFTGATGQKKGLFEVADQGTLFLDEIGDMDLDAQAKVLRVLQSGELTRVGGHTPIQVDVRVVAATHRNLQEMAQSGEFRDDLFFRLAVVPIRMPPLRERLVDVPLLARHFIAQACEENGLARKEISEEALAALAHHAWPGNVRELRNVIERMVVLSDGDLELDDVPPELRRSGGGNHEDDELGDDLAFGDERFTRLMREKSELPLKAFREAVERAFIIQRLREHDWNVSRTAEVLGIERTHLHRKLKLLGIQRGEQ